MSEKWKSFWSRLFGGRRRSLREERVLEYVVHRLGNGARLQDVVQDEYVRRMTAEDELRRILADPRIVEGARGRMRRELDLQGTPLQGIPDRPSSWAEDRPDGAKTGRGAPPP